MNFISGCVVGSSLGPTSFGPLTEEKVYYVKTGRKIN